MESKALAEGFGTRLRELRKARGLTQESLATSAGVTQQTIHQYEKGATLPSLEFIYTLKDHGFDLQYLLFGARDMARSNEVPAWVVDYIAQTIADVNKRYAAGGLSELAKVKMTTMLLKRYWETPDSFQVDDPLSTMEPLLQGA